MAVIRKPEVDAVVVGAGLAGTIVARALCGAGRSVVALERGGLRETVPDFQSPSMHDELRYSIRKGLMVDAARETVTFRNDPTQTALPIRRWEMFLPGTGVGGAAVHWNGQSWRFQEADFVLATRTRERYGARFADPDLQLQDWGVTYAELEPHYDRWEKLYGICGKAGNLRGMIQQGGNPYEAPRQNEYPNPPMKEPYAGRLFRQGAEKLGYKPFIMPSANMTRRYENPEGQVMHPCAYCGFCERYGCEHKAKASPQTTILPVLLGMPGFELRTQSQVLQVTLDRARKRATGVRYVDGAGREVFQPAGLVVVTAFSFNNVRLLLLSGIGKPYDPATGEGVVGRNYAYQTTGVAQAFFGPEVRINPFMAAGATQTVIDEFSGDNFDHGPHGFVGGAYVFSNLTGGRPIEYHPVPTGTPGWGAKWKDAVLRHYNHTVTLTTHGSSMPRRTNYLDLDPTYKDAWGLPLLRMTFDFPANDLRMSAFTTERAMQIARAMGAPLVAGGPRKGPATTTQYQTTHNTGGTVMGADPRTSVVNPWLQSWDVPNVFVVGASNFAHNASYNPTGTVGALAYRAADALVTRWLPRPGPLS